MRRWVVALFGVLSLLIITGATSPQERDDEIARISETYGNLIGSHLEAPGFSFDIDAVARGLRNGAKGVPAPMTAEEYDEAIAALEKQAKQMTAEKNLREAEKFLASNKTAEGVVELIPGKLQYRIVKEGEGESVDENSTPLVNFSGRFIDETLFTSSNGNPVAFPLRETIEGFRKGLIGMKEGEARTLYIHPDLAYRTGGPLPDNALLIFEIELVAASPKTE